MDVKRLAVALPAATTAALLAFAAPAAANVRMYSYDSATAVTRALTETGLTFVFRKKVLGVRILRLMETQNVGEASLTPADDRAVGGGLTPLIGADASERDLYSIDQKGDGGPLIHVLCPGSDKAWLAFGRLKLGENLRVHAIGRDAVSGRPHLCETLDFTFRGEWTLPSPVTAGRAYDPPAPIAPTIGAESPQ